MYGHERSLVEKYSGRPFVLLGVNNDSKISRVKKAIKENNLNWRSFYDGKGGPIVKEYGIRSFPTIFLVDHEGVIRYKNKRGAMLDEALEKLVANAEADGMRGGANTPSAKLREFVDRTGKHKTMASYMGFDGGKVVLQKEDGSEIKVPWNKLSSDDLQYVARCRLKEADYRKAVKRDAEFQFEEPFVFTDKSGKKSLAATFIALYEGKAILWKENGDQVSIAWKKLSDKSKDYVNTEIKRMR